MDENVNAIEQVADIQPAAPGAEKPEGLDTAAEGAEKPETAESTDADDPEKLPSWAKKKMRNLERSLRHELRKRGEFEARLQDASKQAHNPDYQNSQDDSEPLSLTKAELARLVQEEAKKLAPVLRDQESTLDRRAKVAEGLAKTWGQDGFNQRAQDLDAAFNGLTVGKDPKPAVDAIFEADNAAAVIDYLTDPDNSDEALSISRMSAVQAGRAITKLELKLEGAKKSDKPKPSNAPAPIESDRGRGKINSVPDPSDTKAWMRWANEQEAKGLYR